MTKIIDRSIIFCVVFFVILAFSGCAGQAHRVKDDAVKAGGSGDVKTVKVVKTTEKRGKPAIVDDTGKFELVYTPFGYIKRPIRKTERVPMAPVAPAIKVSSPSPAESKSSDKMAKTPGHIPTPREALKESTDVPEETGKITFNFDDADIYEVIRTMSELLRINYIIDPNVRGKVSIHMVRGIPQAEVFPIFRQILEANGLAIVKEGAVHKIVSMKDISRMPIALRPELDINDISPS